jgi:short-subunit dehydrogenase
MPTILILGATSDVAKALAHKYAAAQYNIQLAGRNMANLETIKKDIEIRWNVTVTTHAFDANNAEQIQHSFNALLPLPDMAIAVFGYLGETEKALVQWEESANIINGNYTGAVAVFNVLATRFAQRKSGVLVGISSVAGERGRQSNFMYGSAKAGFTAYLSGLRNWLYPHGVHVLTVKPGFIYTRMTAGLKLPALLTATPAQVSASIKKAVDRKKNVIYTKWFWRYIMMVIKLIPEGIFKKLKL